MRTSTRACAHTHTHKHTRTQSWKKEIDLAMQRRGVEDGDWMDRGRWRL